MARESEAARLDRQIREQQNWIADHGATLTDYIVRYGSAKDAQHYGDGGEAIYAADVAALTRLVEDRKALRS